MAVLGTQEENNLPDSAFAYIEPGGRKDSTGKTTPRSYRHFPVHDAAHARNALARAPQSPYGKRAMPKILAACRRFGVTVDGAQRSAFGDDISDYAMHPERRFVQFPPEVRSSAAFGDPDAKHIYGYASVFNKMSRKLGGFHEQVRSTAFDESKASGWPDVVCRYNHKDDQLLGTTHARTLELHIDNQGLMYDVLPPNSRADVLEYVQRGDVRHSSFAFRVYPGGDEWGLSEYNYPLRTLHSVQLIDVAPVLDPAYPDATAGSRSMMQERAMSGALESLAQWVQAEPDEVRSYLDEGRAVEFFKRSDRQYGPKISKTDGNEKRSQKPRLSGAQAMLAALENMKDPWAGEDF